VFKRCGFSYQRPAKVYKSRRKEDVLKFEQRLEKKLLEIVQEAPETVILAEDEASLYLQATLERIWAPRGRTPVVFAAPSRKKTNFYGTPNLATGQVITTRSDEMNAEATASHLRQVLEALPDCPILLLWDRAPWHRDAAIRSAAIRRLLAKHPRLEVMRFPVAAPEPSPQEQVWKATRQAVSHNHDRSRLDRLADSFERHLKTTRFPCSLLERYGFTAVRPMFI
jgi:transposase